MNTKWTVIVTLITAICYSLLLYILNPQQLWDWTTTLVASGLSFFLAIVAGIYLYNHQKKSKDISQGEDLQLLLAAELSDINRILNTGTRMTVNLPSQNSIEVLITYIQPLVIEKAALSGLYNEVKSENLLHLARKIKIYNIKTDYFMGLLQSGPNEEMMIHANNNIEETRMSIIETIQLVVEQFDLDLTDSQNYS